MTLAQYRDAVAMGMLLMAAIMKDHPQFEKLRDEHLANIKRLKKKS